MVIGWKRMKGFVKKIVSASGDGLWSTPRTFVNTLVTLFNLVKVEVQHGDDYA